MKPTFAAALCLWLALASPGAQAGSLEEAAELYGQGDYAAAVEIARPLAEAGEAQAQVMLGRLYEAGNGVEQSMEEAVKWYTAASEKGDAEAMYALASC
jgi:uncharacterized protein